MLTQKTEIKDIHMVRRPGLGEVYRGKITIGGLARALNFQAILYAPKYQRGFKKNATVTEADYDRTLKIDDERLEINRARAATMAVKYLMAVNDAGDKMLYNPDIIWNARVEPGFDEPEYDAQEKTLAIYSPLTIPDSGHRHFAYWLLDEWKKDPNSIPKSVEVEKDGESIDRNTIEEWLDNFDQFDEDNSCILVEIFNLLPEHEGRLFDEYNDETKRPSEALSIDMYSGKDPSRRFVRDLMMASKIFAPSEVETRATTIGSKSRKLTTNSTMVSAIKPFSKKLLFLEKHDDAGREDLLNFFEEFFEEWARHYTEFLPTAKTEDRQELRKISFALSNIMFFPLFRLAFELWESYYLNDVDWKGDSKWKDALAKLSGNVQIPDPGDKSKEISVPVMARDCEDPKTIGNSAWKDSILVPRFDKSGNLTGHSLSSTRHTRDAAFSYLFNVAKPDLLSSDEKRNLWTSKRSST